MSSICKALGVASAPTGTARDVRAEGVAQMMLDIRDDWNAPVSSALIRKWHGSLMANDQRGIRAGEFRDTPVCVVKRNGYGESEIIFEAPPPERVPGEIGRFAEKWSAFPPKPADIALKAAMMHPHFESIHPFEDGNGRVGRALVAKTLCEGLGLPLVLPVSTIVARHRRAYYDEINGASRALDWTSWAAFFISILTELLTDFVSAAEFVRAKRDYLDRYEPHFSERARKVVMRMFKDGKAGAQAGLTVAKWMRMAKVSKPTATRELAELAGAGAIVAHGDGNQVHYYLNNPLFEPEDPINDPISGDLPAQVLRVIDLSPGINRERLALKVGRSVETVKRAIAALVAAGRIEHRGSRKTGGYFAVQER
jgi:Fic family protein